jgi:hypothetical protein
MPTARRMHNREADRAEIRREERSEIRRALADATDFESFRDAMAESEPAALTFSTVAGMSEAQVNERWPEVSRILERGPDAESVQAEDDDSPPEEPQPPEPRRPTGQQLSERPADSGLTLDAIKRMSVEEIVARQREVVAVLARGGR